MESSEKLFLNPMKGDLEMVIGVGELLLKQLVMYASDEGYKGDEKIFNSVHEELKQSAGTVIIESCYTNRVVSHIEASFLFQEQENLIDSEAWLGGYHHTIEVNRRDEVETHSATVLRGPTGRRIVIDWLAPTVWKRDDDKENLLRITREHASKAVGRSRELLNLLRSTVREIIEFPGQELTRCHIPKTAHDRILDTTGLSDVTRYRLIEACSDFAGEHDYEVADYFWRVSGRLLGFAE